MENTYSDRSASFSLKFMAPLYLQLSRSTSVDDLWGRKLSFASEFWKTTHSHGFGNVNAIKTRVARRMSIMMMFSLNFAFLKEKSGA